MAKSQGRIAGAVPRRQKQRRQGGSPGAAQLQGIASFVALPLPMRLGGAAAAAGRSAAGATRRYHFVKRLKPKPTPDAEVAAPSGDADDGGDDPRLRTILIANFDGVEAELRRVYGAYGAIEAASCPGGRGGEASTKGIARVVFEDRQAVDAVMGVSAARAEEEAAAVAAAEQELAEGVTAMAEADSDGDGDDDDDDDDDGISINLGSPEGSADSDAAEPEARPKTGLRKWLSEHFQARPGIAALQARGAAHRIPSHVCMHGRQAGCSCSRSRRHFPLPAPPTSPPHVRVSQLVRGALTQLPWCLHR
eukprot:COSAG01_NODE_4691_length_4808_cov_14.664897_2_plen_307_part_00